MTSKQQPESVAEMQKEKERERRRLRDRERRQNMSREQRERHLARRRRNYQLRRIRAQNAKLLESQNIIKACNSRTDLIMINAQSPASLTVDLSSGAQSLRKMPKRLRLSDIKHLARKLHCNGHHQTETSKEYAPRTKRLRLIHIKRLARTLKV